VPEPFKGCFKKGDRHLEDSEPVPFLKRFLSHVPLGWGKVVPTAALYSDDVIVPCKPALATALTWSVPSCGES
jgi:hypothetical protein